MKNNFFNKSGELSLYGLNCGYVEKKKTATMYKELYIEHSHIHVRSGLIGAQYDFWETFNYDNLTKARKFYRQIKLT